MQWLMIFVLVAMTGCTAQLPVGGAQPEEAAEPSDVLPELAPVALTDGAKLQVVATTNLVADVVATLGGDQIALHTLMAAGVDPHSYTSTPDDLRALADADVIFINGLHLEAGLEKLWSTLDAPVVPVSVGITALDLAEDGAEEGEEAGEDHAHHEDEHHHKGEDPHTWQSVANVKVWSENIRAALSQLDPTHAADYQASADAYQQQLDTLDAEIREKVSAIPADARKLVTDHDTFGYFVRDYDFVIIGALIPSLSTTAEPSAQSLAALQDQITQEGVKAIFVGTTVNPRLAEQLAQDLQIQVVSLYSDSLSAADGPAATYLDFMRYNVNAIVNALQ